MKKVLVFLLLLCFLPSANAQSKPKSSKLYMRCLALEGVIDDLYLKNGKEIVRCKMYSHAFHKVFTVRHRGVLYFYDVPNPVELKKMPVLKINVPAGCKTGVLLARKKSEGQFEGDLVNLNPGKIKWGSLIMYNHSSSLIGSTIDGHKLSFKRGEQKVFYPKRFSEGSKPLALYFGKKSGEMSLFYTGGINFRDDQRLFCFFVDSEISSTGAPKLNYVRDSKKMYDAKKKEEQQGGRAEE